MAFLRQTTLVLGAGASNHYGFPLGVGLRDMVCGGLNDGGDLRGHLSVLDHSYEEIESFLDELQHSAYRSVDAFLENNREFLSIGKDAIAATLLPWEVSGSLFPSRVKSTGHWYEYLVEQMGVGSDDWDLNKLAILTYNYDRSVEHYFISVIANRFDLPESDAIAAFQKIPFVHLHGSLGGFPPGVPGNLPYGVDMTPDNIRVAADGIKVVTEIDPNETTFDDAEKILSNCDQIYFLGFGFAAENIKRLRIFEDKSHYGHEFPFVGGTSMGFTEREWSEVFNGPLNQHWDNLQLNITPMDYLRTYAQWG